MGTPITPQVLGRLYSSLPHFRVMIEQDGRDEVWIQGVSVSVWELEDQLKSLSHRHREALALTAIRGLEAADAARVMGLGGRDPGQVVRKYRRLALQELATRFWGWSPNNGNGNGHGH